LRIFLTAGEQTEHAQHLVWVRHC